MKLPAVGVYDDDSAKPADCPIISKDDYLLTEMLTLLGREEAAKMARPVVLLGPTFKPMQMLDRLKEYAAACDGQAALCCINRQARTVEIIWNYQADASLNRLVNIKANGGDILGYLQFDPSGVVLSFPENGPEQPLYACLLATFARMSNPEWRASEELLSETANPNKFDPQNAEQTLDMYSDWSDRNPVNIHDEISYPENVQVPGEQ